MLEHTVVHKLDESHVARRRDRLLNRGLEVSFRFSRHLFHLAQGLRLLDICGCCPAAGTSFQDSVRARAVVGNASGG